MYAMCVLDKDQKLQKAMYRYKHLYFMWDTEQSE